MKRNQFQMNEDKHCTSLRIKDDTYTVNTICELYDMGVTINMIKMIFRDIETERKNDEMNDERDFESRL